MDKQQMINEIYKVIMNYNGFESYRECNDRCMIGDVLDWIEKRSQNNRFGDYDIEDLMMIILDKWNTKKKPIENQSKEAILFVYSLIND